MAAPPQWAQDLLLEIAVELNGDLPALVWRRSRKRPWISAEAWRHSVSSGGYRLIGNRITITAGADRRDQKLVLLHEIAHWIICGEGHTDRFWDQAWTLYRRYKVPILYAKKREGNYRKGAVLAYARSLK